MSKHRYNCKFCGRGFLAKPWDKNGMRNVCKKARCEKKAGIYERPAVQLPEKMEVNGECAFEHDHVADPELCIIHN